MFFDDPVKAKRLSVLFIVLACIFFVLSGVLGYLYYQKTGAYRKLGDEKLAMELAKNQEISELRTQGGEASTLSESEKSTLEKQLAALQKDKKTLQDEVSAYQTKAAKIKAYNEFFKYLNSVIETHAGFTGWTDAEFQIGRQKAEATGDASFVSTVNWAWYETTVPPLDRVLRVLKEIASGIEGSLG